MPYALIQDNQIVSYPYDVQKFRMDNPLISLPVSPSKEQLEEQGIYLVNDTIPPETNESNKAVMIGIQEIDGQWQTVWEIQDKTEEEIQQYISEREALVTIERDRRIDAGMEFNGIRFQTRPADRENIMGAFALASAYVAFGGDPVSYTWHDPIDGESPFAFIAEDNTPVPMTAYDVVNFGKAAARMKSLLIFKAREIKENWTIDYLDDAVWELTPPENDE